MLENEENRAAGEMVSFRDRRFYGKQKSGSEDPGGLVLGANWKMGSHQGQFHLSSGAVPWRTVCAIVFACAGGE